MRKTVRLSTLSQFVYKKLGLDSFKFNKKLDILSYYKRNNYRYSFSEIARGENENCDTYPSEFMDFIYTSVLPFENYSEIKYDIYDYCDNYHYEDSELHENTTRSKCINRHIALRNRGNKDETKTNREIY